MLKYSHLVFASKYVQENHIKCLSLPESVPTNPYASGSVLLSLAAHLTFKFPYLDIFTHEKKNCPEIQPQKQQVHPQLSHHPFFQMWCDLFNQSIFNQSAIRKDDTLYLVIQLKKQQMDLVLSQKNKLIETQIPSSQNWIDNLLKKVSGMQEDQKLPRKSIKVTYLNVAGSQLRNDPYMPNPNVKAIIMGQIFNNENWESFDILKNQIPSLQHFLQTDNVIIPGSTNSVLSQDPAIIEMSKNLFEAFTLSKKLKIFGICYGHQLIALYNKGRVIKKERADKVEKMEYQEKLINELKEKHTFLEKLINPQGDTFLLKFHQDYVEEVSDDFYVLGSSQTSKVEFLLHKSGRMLSFQSHPQYLKEYIEGLVKRFQKYTKSPVPRGPQQNIDIQMRKIHHQSSMRIRGVISQFLNFQF